MMVRILFHYLRMMYLHGELVQETSLLDARLEDDVNDVNLDNWHLQAI